MKNELIAVLLCLILCAVVAWGSAAIVLWEPNPAWWPQYARAFMVIVFCGGASLVFHQARKIFG